MTEDGPWWVREKVWAVSAVIAIHLALGWWLLQPRQVSQREHVADIVLVILAPEPEPEPEPEPAAAPVTVAPSTGNGSAAPAPSPDPFDALTSAPSAYSGAVPSPPGATEPSRLPAPAPAVIVEGEDRWHRSTATDQIDFRPHALGRRREPMTKHARERFPMRRELAPSDIVKGVAQVLGFWPPGYTDDPCGGIQRTVELLGGAGDDASRRQLADAVEARAKYCP